MHHILACVFALACAALLSGCTEAPVAPPLQTAPEGAEVQRIYIATQHGDLTRFRTFGNPRQDNTRYFSVDVSVPPGHVPGRIETARVPDPNRHFALVGAEELDLGRFINTVNQVPSENRSVGIFVHGYNTNLIQAGLRLAQLQTDYEVPFPLIGFAWPSSGELQGYVYDRDSALFARDGLAALIEQIHRRTGRKVSLVAHSMGTLLSMETLRQLAIERPGGATRLVESVVLISPDIDRDVFRGQLRHVAPLPQPFVVVSAREDRALQISSLITGRRGRLGTLTRAPEFESLGVRFIDVSPLASGRRLDHNIPFTSPGAMQALVQELAAAP